MRIELRRFQARCSQFPFASWRMCDMWKLARLSLPLTAIALLAAGCGGAHPPVAVPNSAEMQTHRKMLTLPKYVIVLVQENRTVDNLFQTQPGVDTQSFGIDSHGNRVPLTPENIGAPWGF